MKLPVDTPQFWKGRIDRAARDGKEHYSVYLAHQASWDHIAEIHKGILQRETPGFKVLDAGCAWGRASEWLTAEQYTGVDLSPDFIAIAKKKYPNKTFSQTDLRHLPFRGRHFDIAFCISIRAMVIGNLGQDVWDEIETELRRVADKILILEYETPETYYII